jgi:peptidoglycan lytic transglycosylase G
VTDKAPPSNGKDRAATPPRAATARPAEKASTASPSAAAKAQPSTAAKVIKPGLAKPAAATVPKPPVAPRPTTIATAAKPNPTGSATPQPPRLAGSSDKIARAPIARPANGKATTSPTATRPPAASSVPRPSAARPGGRAVPGAGEPYPPEGLVDGSAAGKANKHLTPRSPRTALEPDTVALPPSRRSKRARHPFVVIGNAIMTLFILVAVVAAFALVIGKQRFDAPGPLAEDKVVNIPRGSGIRDISDVLLREGVIDQSWVFLGGVLALKAREDLKAGEYQFKAHASLRDVVATIVEGRVVAHQLTIPEGLTSEQIVARLLDDDVVTGNIKEIPREGSLLPDTYNFNRGVTREQMIQRMQQAQQRVLKEVWDRHSPDLPIKTPEQLVVLASLVEKETGKPEERTRVAAVFVNRLKQKMRLQSDPTIIYGLVGGKGTLGRALMRSEIEQPTPYNTYQIDGLPPGPIANPGRASLEAAANPARTRELYFVADGTGGHAFAETYEQHQRNVARLRAMEAGDQKDQAPAEAQSAQPAAQAPAAAAPQQRRAPARHNQNTQNQNSQTAR